eukprot:389329-Pelagomonas_calceolata.AAC.4
MQYHHTAIKLELWKCTLVRNVVCCAEPWLAAAAASMPAENQIQRNQTRGTNCTQVLYKSVPRPVEAPASRAPATGAPAT